MTGWDGEDSEGMYERCGMEQGTAVKSICCRDELSQRANSDKMGSESREGMCERCGMGVCTR